MTQENIDTWFKRERPSIITENKKDLEGVTWWRCVDCSEALHQKKIEACYYVCPKCGFHDIVSSSFYFDILFDKKKYTEFAQHIVSSDPLSFKDLKTYKRRLKEAEKKTGLKESCRNAIGKLAGIRTVVVGMDFDFIGGSMGSAMGEKIARAIRKSLSVKAPLIIISRSGGARMMEAALSLMQMAKTSALLTQLSDARIPYISLMTHPTTGGVTASFAMLGDINIAEPNALIGFAGPRVIKETIRRELPRGFQRSEFLKEHGFIDMIVSRNNLKKTLEVLLKHMLPSS